MKIVLSKSGLSRGFAFITAPDHMCTELIKLNGIDFNSRRLTIEEAQVKRVQKEEAQTERVINLKQLKLKITRHLYNI